MFWEYAAAASSSSESLPHLPDAIGNLFRTPRVPLPMSTGACAAMSLGLRRVPDLRVRTAPINKLVRPQSAESSSDAYWAAIVGRCLQGDGPAWVELVRAHQARVYGLCYRFTGSAQDAEDLTQDLFLKVFGHLRAFDQTRGSLAVWVITLTRNLLVDHYRRSRLQRASSSMEDFWLDEDAPSLQIEDARPGPYAHALQRHLEREVQAALARISPELREAVILRDLQDMDYKDIAVVLGIPQGTVKSRISRGRAELARLLSRRAGEVS